MTEADTARLFGYLTHILQAIDRIHNYTEELNEVAFLQNEMAQDAVIRNLEVIGEASRNIRQRYPEFADAHPELPLASAYEMRNVLAHGYFKVDLTIVWKTLEKDLPELQAQTRVVIEAVRLDSESDSSD
ncbi:MAG: DUF86 domain-containing protein [Halieaceae bacterium]|nr:DUF86 domain-containing protein [Halieaceae bacterium]